MHFLILLITVELRHCGQVRWWRAQDILQSPLILHKRDRCERVPSSHDLSLGDLRAHRNGAAEARASAKDSRAQREHSRGSRNVANFTILLLALPTRSLSSFKPQGAW